MKQISVFLLFSILLLASGCSDNGLPLTSVSTQHLEVYVHSAVQRPVAGIAMEILETGAKDTTDTTGIARFDLRPGNYTVRVYGLNGPGPIVRQQEDFPVSIHPGENQRLEVFDCLECV